MLALVGIRSNVMCISYNKSTMAELCSRCPVEQKHGRAVCVSGQTRPCVCVCVCTQPPTLAAAALWLSSVHFSWAV